MEKIITKEYLQSMLLPADERESVIEDCETGDYDDQVEARETKGFDDCVIQLLKYIEDN